MTLFGYSVPLRTVLLVAALLGFAVVAVVVLRGASSADEIPPTAAQTTSPTTTVPTPPPTRTTTLTPPPATTSPADFNAPVTSAAPPASANAQSREFFKGFQPLKAAPTGAFWLGSEFNGLPAYLVPRGSAATAEGITVGYTTAELFPEEAVYVRTLDASKGLGKILSAQLAALETQEADAGRYAITGPGAISVRAGGQIVTLLAFGPLVADLKPSALVNTLEGP